MMPSCQVLMLPEFDAAEKAAPVNMRINYDLVSVGSDSI